jgi:hypothetical protein
MTAAVVIADGHVHVHPGARVPELLEAASDNFRRAAHGMGAREYQAVLMLAEMSGVDWFGGVHRSGGMTFDAWTVAPWAHDPLMLRARCQGSELAIAAGRQVVSLEGIEVLALLTRATLVDGLDLAATVNAVRSAGALAVLPWGAGKWLGTRGRLVSNFVSGAMRDKVFTGDNGGRPGLWPMPEVLHVRKADRPVISGSDPLPLPGEERRAGSFGIWMEGRLPQDQPGAALHAMLTGAGAGSVHAFGEPERVWRFVHNQLALRLGRRLAAA